jgi:quercetin dioxygenase-like cupin family protein
MSQRANFFRLDDAAQGMARQLAPGVATRIFPGEHAMLSVVRIEPGHRGTMHHHPEEQWGVCLEGSATRFQGDEAIPVARGDFWRTPGGVPHTMEAGPEGCTVLDVFAPPREAYRNAGSGFGTEADRDDADGEPGEG